MTERPDDMTTLYSQAHLQGARYLDFSASRREVRGQFRLRIVPGPAPQREAQRPPVLPPGQPVEQVEGTHQAQTPELPALRDEVGPRWYALHSVFNPAESGEEDSLAELMSLEDRPPLLVVFSLAGGVGKTCLVAPLGRALAALGEHVLLADTAVYGPLPLYFGSREFKPGVVRTFSPPGGENNAPVQVLTLEPERYPGDGADEHDPLLGELGRDGRDASDDVRPFRHGPGRVGFPMGKFALKLFGVDTEVQLPWSNFRLPWGSFGSAGAGEVDA